MIILFQKRTLLFVSFIEGASVMAAEICGAKLLAPFFGTSLYVWSSVMAITLAGLASGYFFGGQLTISNHKEKKLLYVLSLAILWLCVMPFIALSFYYIASYTSLLPAVTISSCILLFPTMLCMGATSPLIISLLTTSVEHGAENSGKVYAISTLGGIIATFLCGFYLIPTIGITYTLLFFAMALSIATILCISSKKIKLTVILIPFLGSLLSFISHKTNGQIIYETDGMYGNLKVKEELITKTKTTVRKILINNIIQTEMNLLTHQSVSEYAELITKNIAYFPKGNALILGLGGGLVSNVFIKNNYHVTSVELDERMIKVAYDFFSLNKLVRVVCDDARHYMNTSTEKYNMILCDVFKGEEQPAHIITKQSLVNLKMMLDTNAWLVINTHGYLNGKKGLGTQSLLKTFSDADFNIKLCSASNNEDYRNVLIIASIKPITQKLLNEIKLPNLSEATINTDDKPVLEMLNAEANLAWRINYLKNYILVNN